MLGDPEYYLWGPKICIFVSEKIIGMLCACILAKKPLGNPILLHLIFRTPFLRTLFFQTTAILLRLPPRRRIFDVKKDEEGRGLRRQDGQGARRRTRAARQLGPGGRLPPLPSPPSFLAPFTAVNQLPPPLPGRGGWFWRCRRGDSLQSSSWTLFCMATFSNQLRWKIFFLQSFREKRKQWNVWKSEP